VAAAVQPADGQAAGDRGLLPRHPGLTRTDDLELLGLRGSNTAAIRIHDVASGPRI
jgi:alkylation response protein AidB-like acyl-CoA dehydrogenase